MASCPYGWWILHHIDGGRKIASGLGIAVLISVLLQEIKLKEEEKVEYMVYWSTWYTGIEVIFVDNLMTTE